VKFYKYKLIDKMNNASRVFIGIFFCFINMTLIQCTSGKKISMEEKEVLVSKIGAEVQIKFITQSMILKLETL